MGEEGVAVRAIFGAAWALILGAFYLIRFIIRWTIVLIKYLAQSRTPNELQLQPDSRFEHTLILGGSGHGKTQLLQNQFLRQDLASVLEQRSSVIIIDSQGDMINKILRLRELSPHFTSPDHSSLAQRTIIIDPNDVENPPCLNLFDFGLERVFDYSAVEREKLINGAIALYEYIFSALLGAELTNRQGVIFRYLARLLMVVPGATIYTLMDMIEDPRLVKPYLHKLDMATQRFLTTQLLSPAFENTRQQISTRLWGVLSNNTLARMFSHSRNKVNLFEAMNDGSLILINTAKDLLKQDGCELFGRFMIALITQATQERAAIPENKRLPTYVYIDEAHDYFEEDAGIEILLNTARKYKVGLVLAAQNLRQFSRGLQATVMASTSIKMVGGLSHDDAVHLAKEMNTTPEMLSSLKKENGESQFAMYIRNVITEPAVLDVPLGELENYPRMSAKDHEELLAANRKRYCAPYDPTLLIGSQALANAGVQFDLEAPKVL